jgi:hypothetical protein
MTRRDRLQNALLRFEVLINERNEAEQRHRSLPDEVTQRDLRDAERAVRTKMFDILSKFGEEPTKAEETPK